MLQCSAEEIEVHVLLFFLFNDLLLTPMLQCSAEEIEVHVLLFFLFNDLLLLLCLAATCSGTCAGRSTAATTAASTAHGEQRIHVDILDHLGHQGRPVALHAAASGLDEGHHAIGCDVCTIVVQD